MAVKWVPVCVEKLYNKPSTISVGQGEVTGASHQRLCCVICSDDFEPNDETLSLKCGHNLCRPCLRRGVKLSLREPVFMFARCCGEVYISCGHVISHSESTREFEEMEYVNKEISRSLAEMQQVLHTSNNKPHPVVSQSHPEQLGLLVTPVSWWPSAREESTPNWHPSHIHIFPLSIKIHESIRKAAYALAAYLAITTPAIAAAQHLIPDAVLHAAAGLSITAGATIPPLKARDDVTPGAWIAAYSIWGISFLTLFILELIRHPNRRRLLVGMVLFSGLNLVGSLAQGETTILDAFMFWGPLALSASLCLMPVLIEFMGPRDGAMVAVDAAGL